MQHSIIPKPVQRAGAAGWALLVWIFGGSLGLAVVVFLFLKVIGE